MSFLSQIRGKPWLPDDKNQHPAPSTKALGVADEKVGLWVFLAVVGSLFLIFSNAYVERREYDDWRALPELGLLWFNTAMLILSSITLQWTRILENRERIKIGLLSGGFFACAFLIGQLCAWQQFADMGYLASTNPASSFFYLITGVHGLHVLGGLVALLRTCLKTWGGFALNQVQLSVSLCSVYWHFLLLVWLVFFGLMFFS